MLLFSSRICAADHKPTGQHIYTSKCASCHGAKGEGTGEKQVRLEGDRSLAELTTLISETMPEDNPGSLTTEEVQTVAAYVYEQFYSALAKTRQRPVRIELARLTVRQYRGALADLIASFGKSERWGDDRGLRGEYFADRAPGDRNKRAVERIDAHVDFDFGTEKPLPEVENAWSFSIRWSGSVWAPETGEYEFMIRTNHATRLWINDMRRPLIDAWVRSGDETQHKATMYLVGGRSYPLRLEFSKATQGVQKEDEQKDREPPPAFISLLWQRPHRLPEVVPASQLSPSVSAETFICSTPFPPDDRSYGWERGTSISPEWDAATTTAALEVAEYVVNRLNELAEAEEESPQREEKLRIFCQNFAERAFRQPLDDDVLATYIERQFKEATALDAAVRRVVLMVLKSPRFLYRELGGTAKSHDVASRLSFGLWDSIPDRKLLKAARTGRLATADDIRREAERMLVDPRAVAKLREFLLKWLKADVPAELSKDPQYCAQFDAACADDLRTSLELLLNEVLDSEHADYRQLLLTDEVYLNHRLAKLYGVEVSPESGFVKVKLDDGQRAGVLTHPYLMARFADRSESSPIHRGVFLARGVLGHTLRPPPEAVAPLPPTLHPDLTTRERVTLQTKAPACMSCHAIINPLGFTLERYDAIGRYREADRGKAVDDSAVYRTSSGETVEIRGARELANFLVSSAESHEAFVEQLFHHLVQQPVQAYGPSLLQELQQAFVAHDFSIRRLAVEIMVATALVGRETSDGY
jgi:hypothetical protein